MTNWTLSTALLEFQWLHLLHLQCSVNIGLYVLGGAFLWRIIIFFI